MLANAYFLAKFRFDTAENEPAKNLQKKLQTSRQSISGKVNDIMTNEVQQTRAGAPLALTASAVCMGHLPNMMGYFSWMDYDLCYATGFWAANKRFTILSLSSISR